MVDAIFNSEQYVMAKKLLDAAAVRHEALASNIANIETPGYKRVDLSKDFEVQLKNAAGKSDIGAIRDLKPVITEDATAAAVRPDGNNVSMEKELMEDNKNSVEFDFLTQYLSSNLQQLQAAIKVQSN